MSRVRVTVTKDGETITDKECDAVMLGLIADDDCETVVQAPGVPFLQVANLVTYLLKHIEELQEAYPALPEAVLRINEMSNLLEEKEE